MKRLPPAIQEEQRYLRFRVHCEEDRQLGDVVEAIWESLLEFSGSRGASDADIWIIGNRFSEDEQRGVIRVNRGSADEVRAALAMVNSIGGEKGFIEVENVSGTLESLD